MRQTRAPWIFMLTFHHGSVAPSDFTQQDGTFPKRRLFHGHRFDVILHGYRCPELDRSPAAEGSAHRCTGLSRLMWLRTISPRPTCRLATMHSRWFYPAEDRWPEFPHRAPAFSLWDISSTYWSPTFARVVRMPDCDASSRPILLISVPTPPRNLTQSLPSRAMI